MEENNNIINESELNNTEAIQEAPPVEEIIEETTEDLRRERFGRQREKQRLMHLSKYTRKLEEENEQLKNLSHNWKQYSDYTNDAAATHYDNAVHLKLDQAKEKKLKAIQEGDAEGLVQADLELAEAAAKIESLNSWKYQEDAKRQEEAAYYQQQMAAYQQQMAVEQSTPNPKINDETVYWLNHNPWYIPTNPAYNPDLAVEIGSFANALDQDLAQRGMGHAIMGREYYKAINKYVKDLTGGKKSGGGYVGGVRNGGGYGGASRYRERPSLNSQEREMVKLLKNTGVTEESYLKHKMIENNKTRDRVNSRYSR